MRKALIVALAAAAAAMLQVGAAQACRCAGPATPSNSYAKADAVVYGTVGNVLGDFEAEGGARVTLRVSGAWKADVPTTILVETRSTCAYDFRKGETYLAYLTRASDGAPYATTICAGNHTAGDAKDALDWLKRHAKAAKTRP